MGATPQEVQYIDHMGGDLSVVRAAKVSFSDDQDLLKLLMDVDVEGTGGRSHEALIRYLATHNHWTPFAHTAITLRMKAPIPMRTQCFKHKQGFVENEESRRYIKTAPEYYVPVWRLTTEFKKQGSGMEMTSYRQATEDHAYIDHMDYCINRYEAALERGVCEEQARFYLPQGCVVNWYWTGSLAAFARFVKQRTDPHAQGEVQELARMVSDIIKPLYPVCWEALTGE